MARQITTKGNGFKLMMMMMMMSMMMMMVMILIMMMMSTLMMARIVPRCDLSGQAYASERRPQAALQAKLE